MAKEFKEEDLMEEYLNLEGLMHRYFSWKRREHGPHANPHRGQGRILSILKLQPEITQKEMTFLLDMRPQSLGELLTKLEKAGFVTREPSPQDRRVMIVKLTDAGAKEAEKLNQADENSIFDAITDEEKEQFSQIMAKLVKAIEAEMPEDVRYSGRPDGRGFFGGGRPGGFGNHGMEDFGPGGVHAGFPGFGKGMGGQRGGHKPQSPFDAYEAFDETKPEQK
ncbi:MarR family winged helix-turn-helix transcriptional regulator [Carnobacterium gallinarum]|uniref:MarR family winged helix-turn-helix transcriptional regulator n=1 Tax=Carnobacterium gallinarum TaxID=2749 RepID=UPI00068EA3AF|nr:MarR family transcriptional regulator [Carnobacterium gallinarum]